MEKTIVTFLLDRTGSMQGIKEATIEAFNGYLDGLKGDGKGDDLISFTLLQFDSMSLDKVCVAEPISKVAKLTDTSYQPRASTPLIDACVKTIYAVDKSVKSRDDKPKVVVCFQTDGLENASTEHDWDELNKLIKEKTAEGWQFNFLGVGIDAYNQASRMGIAASATLAASPDAVHMAHAFRASASNTRLYASGKAMNTNYTRAQRMSSGDQFHDKHTHDVDLTPPTSTATITPALPKRRTSLVEEPKL